MTMWRKIIFLLLAVTLAWPRVACAQQQTSSLKYKVDYVNEKHLFRKGNQVTLLTLVLEWPERLCGSPLPALQTFLTQELFGTPSTSMKSGLKSYFESLGEELSAMPDEEGLKVEYLSFVVRELAWEPDRFVSFVVAKEKRKSDTDTAELKQNKLLTYDIVRDKVLRTRAFQSVSLTIWLTMAPISLRFFPWAFQSMLVLARKKPGLGYLTLPISSSLRSFGCA